MINRKRLLVISGILIFSLFIIFALINRDREYQDPPINNPEPSTLAYDTEITGIDELDLSETFNVSSTSDITQGLYGFIKTQTTNPKGSYSGNVRKGSYIVRTENNITFGSFLIDIPELQRTIKITLESSSIGGYNTVYFVCPNQSELVYKPIVCSEEQ
jgi:hypothetical protein